MTLVDVGSIDEFPHGKLRVVSVNEREIGIVRWNEEWYALRNICPHLGAPVCDGPMRPFLTQDSVTSADLTVAQDRPILMCPWHNWEFDIRSGRAVTGNELIKTYGVGIEDGRVKLDLDTRGHTKTMPREPLR